MTRRLIRWLFQPHTLPISNNYEIKWFFFWGAGWAWPWYHWMGGFNLYFHCGRGFYFGVTRRF